MKCIHKIKRRDYNSSAKKNKHTIANNLTFIFLLILTFLIFMQSNSFLRECNIFTKGIGILILGLDDTNDKDYLDTYTDSITYIAFNPGKNIAYSLPIYRDAHIDVYGYDLSENVNRIHKMYGIETFIKSIENFLALPVDNFIFITMDDVIDLINTIGGIDIHIEENFTSDYGKDNKSYTFTKGETKRMSGQEVLAYLRYRGNSNGLKRAERQGQVIKGFKDKFSEPGVFIKIIVSLFKTQKIMCNFSLKETIFYLEKLFNLPELRQLKVVAGENYKNKDSWEEIINEADLVNKTDLIRNDIFLFKNCSV